MPTGDGFTSAERHDIDKAIRDAETVCRCEFSVFVGVADGDTRAFAERLHATLVAPRMSVLIMVDPAARVLEVVTGSEVRRDLDDGAVTLAALSMQSAFGAGDIVGGIKRGVQMLADHARKPRTLHAQ